MRRARSFPCLFWLATIISVPIPRGGNVNARKKCGSLVDLVDLVDLTGLVCVCKSCVYVCARLRAKAACMCVQICVCKAACMYV